MSVAGAGVRAVLGTTSETFGFVDMRSAPAVVLPSALLRRVFVLHAWVLLLLVCGMTHSEKGSVCCV